MIEGFDRNPQTDGTYGQLLFTPDAAARRAFELGTVLASLFALVQLLSAFCPMLLIEASLLCFFVHALPPLWIWLRDHCCSRCVHRRASASTPCSGSKSLTSAAEPLPPRGP